MENKHRLDAPDNEALADIEQLTDRSELSTLYFTARKEWEGKEIVSEQERAAIHRKEQRNVTLTIRKLFAAIAILVPTPVILLVILVTVAGAFLTMKNALSFYMLVIAAIITWATVSYLAIRRVYAIFYNHALNATPFIVIFVALLGISAQAAFLFTRPLHGESHLLNTLIVCAGVYAASIPIAGILLYIWTSFRLSSSAKTGYIAALAISVVGAVVAAIL